MSVTASSKHKSWVPCGVDWAELDDETIKHACAIHRAASERALCVLLLATWRVAVSDLHVDAYCPESTLARGGIVSSMPLTNGSPVSPEEKAPMYTPS